MSPELTAGYSREDLLPLSRKTTPNPKRKYILLLDNWRPICLLNNDYKIIALVLAKHLKNVLDYIIDETQSGFMKGRHISNNIRLVLDIKDSSDSFLDFKKSF